jgi:hypothetical protein
MLIPIMIAFPSSALRLTKMILAARHPQRRLVQFRF